MCYFHYVCYKPTFMMTMEGTMVTMIMITTTTTMMMPMATKKLINYILRFPINSDDTNHLQLIAQEKSIKTSNVEETIKHCSPINFRITRVKSQPYAEVQRSKHARLALTIPHLTASALASFGLFITTSCLLLLFLQQTIVYFTLCLA